MQCARADTVSSLSAARSRSSAPLVGGLAPVFHMDGRPFTEGGELAASPRAAAPRREAFSLRTHHRGRRLAGGVEPGAAVARLACAPGVSTARCQDGVRGLRRRRRGAYTGSGQRRNQLGCRPHLDVTRHGVATNAAAVTAAMVTMATITAAAMTAAANTVVSVFACTRSFAHCAAVDVPEGCQQRGRQQGGAAPVATWLTGEALGETFGEAPRLVCGQKATGPA